ncbi:MAG TPA: GNAT family N-acetyltransferase [Thermohalobaculum sp.]|nr:GNAT family N-acetyltransferase [Thermohalobaculum sp.]
MTAPGQSRLVAALETTWPPAGRAVREGWTLRCGAGGGKRVSAASPAGPDAGIAVAEDAMRAWGQPPLFRVLPGEEALDEALGARGCRIVDPTVFYAAPLCSLAAPSDETARVFRVSTPLALADEIWEAGGIGAGRRAVMARAPEPKIVLLARLGDAPAGVAFLGLDGAVAMLHAVEVLPGQRRGGAGTMLTRAAATFAAEHGATWLALAVTEANRPARALYEKLGMAQAGRYHYRILDD